MRSLNPIHSYSAFNITKLLNFALFYPEDFSIYDIVVLENQLETYIMNMCSNDEFLAIKDIATLAKKMVERKNHVTYPFAYRLIVLALTLPVVAEAVGRAFFAIKIVKNQLRGHMVDDWFNACLVTCIEKDIFREIDNEAITQRFQSMKSGHEQL